MQPLKADPGFIFESGKVYPHAIGLSCCFRQWRADSHCNQLHGYSIQVGFTFQADILDHRNWVVDFGSLKNLKGWLEDMFDHKTLVAEDDPEYNLFMKMQEHKICEIRVMPSVGMEATAYYIYQHAEQWLKDAGYGDRITLSQVEVREHDANFARYRKNG